ncbi:hypothetical protein AAVH_23570 [Aphelenchoides avenae]|nr:hypothetical protein AAVH_23570 [Aphelenchus avenae]
MVKFTADVILHKPGAACAEMEELRLDLGENRTLSSLLKYLAVEYNIPRGTWLDHFVLARTDDGTRRGALDTELLVHNGRYEIFIILESCPPTRSTPASSEPPSASASSVFDDSSPRRTHSETSDDDAADQDSSGSALGSPFKLTIPREQQMKRVTDEYKKIFLIGKPIPSDLVKVAQERRSPPGVPEKPSSFQMADYYMREILLSHGSRGAQRLLDHTFDVLSRTTELSAPQCIEASKTAVARAFKDHDPRRAQVRRQRDSQKN